MSRLFARIFLSFWVAMVLIVVTAALVNFWVWREFGPSDVPGDLRDRMVRSVERTVGDLQAGQFESRGRGHRFGRHGRRLIHVIDENGRNSNRLPLPPHLAQLADLTRSPERTEGTDFLVRDVSAPDGRRYRVIGVVPVLPRMLSGGHRGLMMRLGVAVTISAFICWLLAWYLVRPVSRLRGAAERLAEGDLSGRVSQDGAYRRDELGALGRDFDRMAGALEASHVAQQQLLRDVSHELRSPLARLQVALELARDADDERRPRHLDRIEAETARLDGLIGDILTLSRQAAERRPLPETPVDLRALLEQVVSDASFEGQPEDRTVHLEAPATASTISGDERLLAQAFENVVRNALVHTPRGTRVTVRLESSGDGMRVRVADQGPGVPEDELPRIFLPFHRVDRARGGGGHGIGLAIARHAVERHGGTISAVNGPDGGLVVTMAFPG